MKTNYEWINSKFQICEIKRVNLIDYANSYETRPSFIIIFYYRSYKKRLQTSARLIRAFMEQKRKVRKLDKFDHDLKERIKELNCLYGISNLAIKPNITNDELIQGVLVLIPPSMQFPELTHVEIKYGDKFFRTNNFKESTWNLSTSLTINETDMLINVYYLEDNPFLAEESHLISEIIHRLEFILGKKKAEEDLKKLNLELEKRIKKRVEELMESEERWRSITKYTPDNIMQLDLDGNILFINHTVPDLSIDEVIGKPIYNFVPEKFKDNIRKTLAKVLSTGKSDKYETGYRDKEGKDFFFEAHVGPIWDSDQIVGFISRSTDVSARKKVEEEYRLHSQIMTNLAEGIYLIRMDDGIIVYTNPRFEEMFGYDPGELIGKDVAIVNAPTDKSPEETKKEIMVILSETGEWHGEILNIKKDGTPFWCYANVSHFDHPEYGKVHVSVHTDITMRKKAEEKDIQKSNIMKAINEVFKKALTCESEEELGKTCLEVAQELSGAKFGFFGEVNSEDQFDTLAISNPGWEECAMPESTATRLIKGMEIRGMQFLPLADGKSRIFNAPSNHPDSVGTPEGHPIIFSLLAVPFIYKGKVIGQIGLGNKDGGFTHDDLEAIETLSVAMIETLLRKRAEDKLKKSEKNHHKSYKRENFYKDLFAHDINNILNGIKGASDLYLLYEKDSTKLKEKESLINIIKDQVTKGTLLVSNVRKLSQLEEDKDIVLKDINIREVIDTAKRYTKDSFQDRSINIIEKYSIQELRVLANELLLDIFGNLFNNAVKYNDSPIVIIQIRVSKKIEDGKNYIKIEFIDNGIGVLDENKEIIFKKGYKKEKGTKGMGFGLTLVKKLIKTYNGKIWVENIVKGDCTQGSNFVILIPEAI